MRRRSKKTSKLRITGLCAGNSPGTGEFPTHKWPEWPVTLIMSPFDDVIMIFLSRHHHDIDTEASPTASNLQTIFLVLLCWNCLIWAYHYMKIRSRQICTCQDSSSSMAWASYQIRKIACCACAGNAGNVSPHRQRQRKPLVSDPGMHHGTCVTRVPWCISGSLTHGGGESVAGIPSACASAILRIWQEAHVRNFSLVRLFESKN